MEMEDEIDLKFRKLEKLKLSFIEKYKEIYSEEGFDEIYFKEFLKEIKKEGLK